MELEKDLDKIDLIIDDTMNIKLLRKRKGWTQQDLAEKVGMTRVSISNMENGKQPISKTVRLALERVFDR